MKALYGKTVLDRLEERVAPSRTALIVVDMQNDFCSAGGMMDRLGTDVGLVQATVPVLAGLLAAARAAGVLVVYLQNRTRSDGRYSAPADLLRKYLTYADEDDLLITLEGSWGEQVIAELELERGDVVIVKHRPDGFERTQLGLILKSNGIESVLITGTSTFACVESTARRALMEDYYVTVVEDCVAATDGDLQAASLTVMRAFFGTECVVPARVLAEVWAAAKAGALEELVGATGGAD